RFFEQCADGLGRDLLDEAQLDRLASQKAQRPVVVPVGDRAARDGDEVGMLWAGEGLAEAHLPFVMRQTSKARRTSARPWPSPNLSATGARVRALALS